MSAPDRVLEVRELQVAYGMIRALQGMSLEVRRGRIVALLGANGAGKTTLLRTISGLLEPRAGSILFEGVEIGGRPPHVIVGRGVAQVPEGRMVFANLTVRENLDLGAYRRRDRAACARDLEFVFHLFPRLRERMKQEAGTLSGGEQQMLAIGRALMTRPTFLMLDEPSLGIAPLLCRSIFEQIRAINREHGTTLLLVEQNAALALEVAHEAYVMESGRITLSGPTASLRDDPQVKSAYLGG